MAFVDVRRGERPQLLIAVGICFGIITAHTMAETARDALFLTHLPARHLPLAYLGIGIASFLLDRLSSRLVARFGQRSALVGILVLGALMSLVFAVAFTPERKWLFYAFYVWVGTFATTSVVELWLFLSQVFTVAQGKRLFGVIGTGASVGTFVGAAVAGAWAQRLPIEHLLLAVALLQLGTAVLPLALPEPPRFSPVGGAHTFSTPGLKLVMKQPYLLRVAGVVVLSSLTLMLVDYQFKAAAAAAVSPAKLASFLGMVYAGLGAGALVVQLTSGRIVRRLGVASTLALLPALLLAGGLALPIVGALGRALAFRSADGTLRHSLNRVAMELLYMPLSPEVRSKVKAFIDGAIGRAGQAIAAVALIGMAALHPSRPLLPVAIMVGSAAWLVLAWTIRRPYVDVFLGTIDASLDTRARFPDLEGASLGVVVAALDSPDERLVIAALGLLEAKGKQRLIPRAILNYRSPAVLVKALDVLASSGRDDLAPAIQQLKTHHDPQVRGAAVRALIELGTSLAGLRRFLGDQDPLVHGVAALERGDASALDEIAGDSLEVRLSLLELISDPAHLPRLAHDDDPRIVRAAARAAERIRDPSSIPFLIGRLQVGEARHQVRQALVGFGDQALDALERALEDPATDPATRRHLPRTMSYLPALRAGEILARNLMRQSDGVVRFKILRALGRLVVERPELRLDPRPIVEAALATADKLHVTEAWRRALRRAHGQDARRATELGRLLVTILDDKWRLAFNRVFRLLAILYPKDRLIDVYGAVVEGEPRARANAVEILENLLSVELRERIVPLCDREDDRSAAIARRLVVVPERYEEALALLAATDDETLAALATRHREELHGEGQPAPSAAAGG